MKLWTDEGQCSSCRHCSVGYKPGDTIADDQDPNCVHPKVLEYFRYGVNLNKAIADFCGDDLKLREAKVVSDVG